MSLTTVLLAGIIALAGFGLVMAAWRFPRGSLVGAFPLVLIATTKLRYRDPSAALAGEIDLQVAYEVGLYVVLGLILLASVASTGFRFRKPSLPEGALLAYVGVAALSVAWSPHPTFTLVRSFQLILLCVLSIVAFRTLGPRLAIGALLSTVVAYVLLLSGLAVAFPFVNGVSQAGTDYARFSWFATHPITAATLAGASAIYIVAEVLFVPARSRIRVLGLPLVVVLPPLVLILLATRSRGAIIAFLIAGSVALVRRYARPWLSTLAVLGSVAILGLLVSATTGLDVTDVVRHASVSDSAALEYVLRGDDLRYMTTLGGRMALWGHVTSMVSASPLVGYGYTSSRSILPEAFPWAGYAHNALAQTLLDLGLLGTALLWFALLRSLASESLRPSWVAIRDNGVRGVAFAVLLFLFIGSFVNESFAGAPSYEVLMLFGCILASDWILSSERAARMPDLPIQRYVPIPWYRRVPAPAGVAPPHISADAGPDTR